MTRLLSSKNLLARYERRGFKSTTTIDRSSCKNKEELQYFPLYDYRTKRPVSFLFLSAGIDGKIDNKLSHNDTLYVHNWWADLNVYNYEEAILLENWNKMHVSVGHCQIHPKMYSFHRNLEYMVFVSLIILWK